jgi:superfamily I DNA/RNA helicase
VRGLDAQQRVLVTGGAGTGKTWLAMDWAKRAVARGERTLVVCFNKPIGEFLQRGLRDTAATVGTYHDVVVRLLEPTGFRVGENPGPEYWDTIPTAALVFHAEKIGQPFDTLIIDEGQDIKPHWLESLEHLLDPAGPQRVLMVADPTQAIYDRDWAPPSGMVTNHLEYNLRNARPIASFVKRLGGPEPLPGAPGNVPVQYLTAGGRKEIAKRVRETVTALTADHGIPYSEILVVTRHKKERDDLVTTPPEGCPMVRWEDRSEAAVLCETVHRAKGLERLAVIYVDTSGEPDRQLEYIGASRAVSWLTLIGSAALATPSAR